MEASAQAEPPLHRGGLYRFTPGLGLPPLFFIPRRACSGTGSLQEARSKRSRAFLLESGQHACPFPAEVLMHHFFVSFRNRHADTRGNRSPTMKGPGHEVLHHQGRRSLLFSPVPQHLRRSRRCDAALSPRHQDQCSRAAGGSACILSGTGHAAAFSCVLSAPGLLNSMRGAVARRGRTQAPKDGCRAYSCSTSRTRLRSIPRSCAFSSKALSLSAGICLLRDSSQKYSGLLPTTRAVW